MKIDLKTAIQIAIGLTGYVAWAIMAYFDPAQRPDFLHFNIGMAVGTIGLVLRDMRPSGQAGADLPPSPIAQSGFARVGMLVFLSILTVGLLAGCGTMNTYTGAVLTNAEQNYAGAKKNAQAKDDMQFILWADTACTMPLGALARNATGNPGAVKAVLQACPIQGVGAVTVQDGQVQVQMAPATPTKPYAPTGQ